MKRKIALLLAAVMTLSAAPMNLFASTTNRLSQTNLSVPDYTQFFEPSLQVGAGEVQNRTGNIEYYTNGSYLIITADSAASIPDGTAFDLQLENAVWNYVVTDPHGNGTPASDKTVTAAEAAADAVPLTGILTGLTKYTTAFDEVYISAAQLRTAIVNAAVALAEENVKETSIRNTFDVRVTDTSGAERAPEALVASPQPVIASTDNAPNDLISLTDINEAENAIVAGTITFAVGGTESTANRSALRGNFSTATIGGQPMATAQNGRFANTIDLDYGYINNNGRYVRDNLNKSQKNLLSDGGLEIPYTINFTSNSTIEVRVDYSLAAKDGANNDFLVQGNTKRHDAIVIPLAIRGDEAGSEISLRITNPSNNANITTSGRFVVASSSGGFTTTAVRGSLRRGSDRVTGINVVISENRIGSIRNGSFRLEAPSGYDWNNPSDWKFNFEGGLSDQPSAARVVADYRTTNNRVNYSHVDVTLSEIRPSSTRLGQLSITGMELIAEDETRLPANSETVQARIRNTGNTDVVSNQTFDIATIANHTLVLSVVGSDIPELVAGRLERDAMTTVNGSVFTPGAIEDEYHKAARVRLRENVGDSWWSTAQTTLVLPEGVQFLKVEFDELANIGLNLINDNPANENNNGGEGYANARRRENTFVTINNNVLTLTNLTNTNRTDRTRVEMDIWLNIEADFEGDIDLTLTNYSVRTGDNSDQSVKIASAIVPVEIETAISDVRIGLQYVPVADFDIIETKAGNLLQGKEVFITVSDEISTDMYLAPGFTHEVTEGNLRISNVTSQTTLVAPGIGSTSGDAQLKFEIDRESTVASTISFSNVQVKIGRDVPFSNISATENRGINLIVWGPAIAENFSGLYNTNTSAADRINTYDLFSTPGIRARYINVISRETNSRFTNVVKVTMGNPVVLINGEEYTMPVAPYVSTASNSTMVPLRFVAYALGLEESAVTWDPATSTATVDAGTRIVQFTTGSTHYLVNGVSVGMVSPDGLPVAMEISEERAFIPFRALGNAFDIPVSWDATTSTAIYNDPALLQ